MACPNNSLHARSASVVIARTNPLKLSSSSIAAPNPFTMMLHNPKSLSDMVDSMRRLFGAGGGGKIVRA